MIIIECNYGLNSIKKKIKLWNSSIYIYYIMLLILYLIVYVILYVFDK